MPSEKPASCALTSEACLLDDELEERHGELRTARLAGDVRGEHEVVRIRQLAQRDLLEEAVGLAEALLARERHPARRRDLPAGHEALLQEMPLVRGWLREHPRARPRTAA